MTHRLLLVVTLLAMIVTSPACLYRVDIHQGNRIEYEKVSQLELGMTRKQVVFLLGEPAIKDTYHADQWHYVHYLKRGKSGEIDKRVMTLSFADEKLSEIEGSLLPGWL